MTSRALTAIHLKIRSLEIRVNRKAIDLYKSDVNLANYGFSIPPHSHILKGSWLDHFPHSSRPPVRRSSAILLRLHAVLTTSSCWITAWRI